jgi:hypothetical protein
MEAKLVHFAHNWNNGMLESWNDGFKETSIQNAYYFIDFLVLMAYFSGKNQKIDACEPPLKK